MHGGVALSSALIMAAAIGLVSVHAQDPRPASALATRAPMRLPDGQPNIEGLYVNAWSSRGFENARWENYTKEERDAYARRMLDVRGPMVVGYGSEWTEPSTSKRSVPYAVVDPPDGKIPWQPWALAKQRYVRDHPYERPEFLDPRVRCLPLGTPRGYMGNSVGVQIIQPPGQVLLLYEFNHMSRVIHLDGRPHPGPDIQLWMGDSRGRWEGNTLVIDVTNFTDKTWIVGDIGSEGLSTGSFHSPALHVVERLTIVEGGHIDYEAMIEDPNVFARPWTLRFPLFDRASSDYQLFEYACHEGNRTMDLTDLAVLGK
jgi:hypothetical protein